MTQQGPTSRRILIHPGQPEKVVPLAQEYQKVVRPEVPCRLRIRPPVEGWFEVIFPVDAPLWHFHNVAKWFEDATPYPEKPESVIAVSEGDGDWGYFLVPTGERKWDRYLAGATAAARPFQYDCMTGKLLDDPRLMMITTPPLAMMARNVPYFLQKPRAEDPEGTVTVDLQVSASCPQVAWVFPEPSDLTDNMPRSEPAKMDDDTDASWVGRFIAGLFSLGGKK